MVKIRYRMLSKEWNVSMALTYTYVLSVGPAHRHVDRRPRKAKFIWMRGVRLV